MPLRALGRVLVVSLCVLSCACATARLRRETTLQLRDADALVNRGCHACLVDALAIYQRIRPADADARTLKDRRVFRVSLLLALREKELGLPAREHLERARALLSTTVPRAPSRERLELTDLVPWDHSRLSREVQQQQNQRLFAVRDRVNTRLKRARTPSDDAELDAYVDLALGCSGRLVGAERFEPEKVVAPLPPSPLLSFRLGACGQRYQQRLETLVAGDARFVEAYWWLGRYLLGHRPGPLTRQAIEAMTKAHAAFPSSPSIAMEIANATRTASYRDAVPFYRQVIAVVPDHQDALFGLGVCQSHLRQHGEAIDTLTRLLALGRWLVGDALYWRAWNRHQLKELDLAWEDVETAKKSMYNSNVFTLAGVIAYDRQELDVARTNLETGRSLEDGNCTAAWYLGLVYAAQERWTSSGDVFAAASGCYRADADDARAQLALAEASDAASETRAEQIASAQATIDESVRQEATSAYNAAFGFVRGNDAARARPWLDLARQHPDMRDRAEELLGFVNRH